jgi:hypothetical protein
VYRASACACTRQRRRSCAAAVRAQLGKHLLGDILRGLRVGGHTRGKPMDNGGEKVIDLTERIVIACSQA